MAELTGVVTSIIFRNDQNGYTVLEVSQGQEEFTAVGVMPFLSEGDRTNLVGEWTDHPTFGPQLKVQSCDWEPPSSLDEIERYLGSGLIHGVGPSTATAIVETFGEATLDTLQTHPERLREVPGIGQKRAAIIAESYQEQRGMRDAMLFLQRYDITPAYALRIYKQYKGATMEVVRQNPYRLVDDVQGIGFATADRIASRIGIAPDSEYRVRSGLQHVLREAANSEGHAYLPRRILIGRAIDLLDVPSLLIENALSSLAITQQVVLRRMDEQEDEAVYLAGFAGAEEETALRLNRLRAMGKPSPAEQAAIETFQREQGIELSSVQQEAVKLALRSGVSVITGGPGTGKTTIIRCIITLLEAAGRKAALCAPTGRAAKRMSEATGREAKTLHRLLEYAPGGEEYAFQKNQDEPLEFDALIVDEVSMVDLFLMRSLLRAIRPGAQLVLVGDVDQLPSVGPGNVLRDIIDSETLPVVRLEEIFRQAQESRIIRNAHAINRGDPPELGARDGDFFFDRRASLPDAAQTVIDLCVRRLPGYFGIQPQDIQVLCPMKRGEAGVYRLNQRLQQAINPPSPNKKERALGDNTLREGDRVMQIRNNYQLAWTRKNGRKTEEGNGVFNGDLGSVKTINSKERTVLVRFDDDREVLYEDAALMEIELSYAMSIHKSQGSEFPAVVIPVVSGPPQLFTRNLLYTAITRARQLVVLVGSEETILRMVENNQILRRYSMLTQRIQALQDMFS